MALANPLPSSELVRKLSKRGEGIHLVNYGNEYSVADVSKPYIPLHSTEDVSPMAAVLISGRI